jgi:2'-5' RNA ligase
VSDRLFFALWPDASLRDALAGRMAALTSGYPCRPQRPDQWHLTIEFLGNVAADRQAALHEAAHAVEGALRSEETVVLDRLEHWQKPQVLCLTAALVPPGVADLAAALKDALRRHGFDPERREFRPHLTLARKARQPVAGRAIEPIRWPVDTLWLVKSIGEAAGSRYEPCARWNLVQASAVAP